MGVSLQEVMGRLPEDRRREVEARTKELIAAEMTLRELRKAMEQTQVAVAAKLDMNQESVSRLEKRADMLLSTLADYVAALGGQLRLVAEFEGRAPVHLTAFASMANKEQQVSLRRSAPASARSKRTRGRSTVSIG